MALNEPEQAVTTRNDPERHVTTQNKSCNGPEWKLKLIRELEYNHAK